MAKDSTTLIPQLGPRYNPSQAKYVTLGGQLWHVDVPYIWILIFCPWLIEVFIQLCSMIDLPILHWISYILPLVATAQFTWGCIKAHSLGHTILGFQCLFGCILGIMITLFAHHRFLHEHWRLDDGASYSNVLPATSALSMQDATTIVFAEGSRVDSSRTYGLLDIRGSPHKTYCVAPVQLDPLSETTAQFWAAGINCCHERSLFNCGDHGGLTSGGAVALPKDRYVEGYRKAVRAAELTYGLGQNDDFMLVDLHDDPISFYNSLLRHCEQLYLLWAAGYLLLSWVIGTTTYYALKKEDDR